MYAAALSESQRSAWRGTPGPKSKVRALDVAVRRDQVSNGIDNGTSHSEESRGGTETSTSESEVR